MPGIGPDRAEAIAEWFSDEENRVLVEELRVLDADALSIDAGGVLLLENLRFHPGEEKNDPDFARQLADHDELFGIAPIVVEDFSEMRNLR